MLALFRQLDQFLFGFNLGVEIDVGVLGLTDEFFKVDSCCDLEISYRSNNGYNSL